jgi:hypothetical protein
VLQYIDLIKTVLGTGTTGLLIWVVYRFADKWAGRFLEASQAQAAAMTSLAVSIKEEHTEQREVLIAVQVMASKMDDLKGTLRDLDEYFRSAMRQANAN